MIPLHTRAKLLTSYVPSRTTSPPLTPRATSPGVARQSRKHPPGCLPSSPKRPEPKKPAFNRQQKPKSNKDKSQGALDSIKAAVSLQEAVTLSQRNRLILYHIFLRFLKTPAVNLGELTEPGDLKSRKLVLHKTPFPVAAKRTGKIHPRMA